jgi:hypothetical protein
MNLKSEDCWWFCLFYFWVTMKKSMFNNRLWINLWSIVAKLTRKEGNKCGLTFLEWEFSGVHSDLLSKKCLLCYWSKVESCVLTHVSEIYFLMTFKWNYSFLTTQIRIVQLRLCVFILINVNIHTLEKILQSELWHKLLVFIMNKFL